MYLTVTVVYFCIALFITILQFTYYYIIHWTYYYMILSKIVLINQVITWSKEISLLKLKQKLWKLPLLKAIAPIPFLNLDQKINIVYLLLQMWKYQTSNQVFSSLLYYSGFVIFGCQDHFLYCLQLEKSSASLKFKTRLDSPISSASCILEQKFIVTPTTAGSIFLISLESGEIQTQINLDAQIFSSPCVCDNRIYIGCRDNNLYCLEINKLKWKRNRFHFCKLFIYFCSCFTTVFLPLSNGILYFRLWQGFTGLFFTNNTKLL